MIAVSNKIARMPTPGATPDRAGKVAKAVFIRLNGTGGTRA